MGIDTNELLARIQKRPCPCYYDVDLDSEIAEWQTTLDSLATELGRLEYLHDLADQRQVKLDKALSALRTADGFNDEVLREWRMEGDTKMCAEHVRRVLRAALAEIDTD